MLYFKTAVGHKRPHYCLKNKHTRLLRGLRVESMRRRFALSWTVHPKAKERDRIGDHAGAVEDDAVVTADQIHENDWQVGGFGAMRDHRARSGQTRPRRRPRRSEPRLKPGPRPHRAVRSRRRLSPAGQRPRSPSRRTDRSAARRRGSPRRALRRTARSPAARHPGWSGWRPRCRARTGLKNSLCRRSSRSRLTLSTVSACARDIRPASASGANSSLGWGTSFAACSSFAGSAAGAISRG